MSLISHLRKPRHRKGMTCLESHGKLWGITGINITGGAFLPHLIAALGLAEGERFLLDPHFL